jgi:hypothetical protein
MTIPRWISLMIVSRSELIFKRYGKNGDLFPLGGKAELFPCDEREKLL